LIRDDAGKPFCITMIENCRHCYEDLIELNEKDASEFNCDGNIEYLLIAESPPCPGKRKIAPYIYRKQWSGKNNLLHAILDSFEEAGCPPIDRKNKVGCLNELAKHRLFVIDICEYPVNKMTREIKEIAYEKEVSTLSKRLGTFKHIGKIIIAIKAADECIRIAIKDARLEDIERHSLPFPDRKKQKDRFIKELSAILRKDHLCH